ncbi:MAG: complex I NDUFA9 subunit family protein [Deltaproteobacteria bacterium]|nr:complex I NDUFA9 subunit family protein [Deltaproteobacteria bacterium]
MEKEPFLQYNEVLVTGGTGFVGRHVCRALIERGFLPRLMVRVGSEERIPEDIRDRCRVTLGDVTIPEDVENAAQGTDAVVHLVGIIRELPGKGVTFERLHVKATRNVVEAARRWGIDRLVHMSALGARAGGPTKYFDTKGRAEEIVRGSGLAWTVFRPSVLFGSGDAFVNELARVIRLAPFIPVPGDGSYRLQPVYAGDVAKGIAEAVLRPDLAGRAFDVGGPEWFSYDGLLDAVAASAGRSARKLHVPLSLMEGLVRFLQRFEKFPLTEDQLVMLLGENVCDHEPFYAAFGFTPTSLSGYLAAGHAGRRPGLTGTGEGGKGSSPELPARKAA